MRYKPKHNRRRNLNHKKKNKIKWELIQKGNFLVISKLLMLLKKLWERFHLSLLPDVIFPSLRTYTSAVCRDTMTIMAVQLTIHLRMASAFAFVPPDDVPPVFENLYEFVNSWLEEVLNYASLWSLSSTVSYIVVECLHGDIECWPLDK